ncbi:MAG: ROK family protein [Verrucomicrobia bacterium]|nr:ROK family protein [Verrucomicrobiota bacterium]MBV9657609.1 ROK family protein [Verrucomicrobiota bacterium]
MKELIGVDIGGTHIKMAAFSSDGEMLATWHRETGDKPTEGVPAFAETVRQMLREVAAPDGRIGIAAPGVAAKDGRAIAFQAGKMHGIEGLDWTELLKRQHVVPVLNDAHAALLGELWRGAAVGARDAILLTLGTGVGGAILSDGRLLTGATGRAGHLGHVSIADSDDRSIFNTPGSLEWTMGNYSVGQRSGGRFSTARELVEAHLSGDTAASELWLNSVRSLARAITSFINILDPEVVIIGGGIAKAGAALFDPLARYLDDMEWRPGGHGVRIVPAALGEWAGASGAAWSAQQS